MSGCSVAPELTGTAVLVHFRAPTSTLTPRPGLFHHASTAHGRRELPAAKRTVTQMVTDDMPFLADSVALDAPPRCSQVHVDAAASRHPPRRVRQRQPSRVVDAHGVRPHHRPGPLAQVRHDRQLSPNGPEPHARSSSSTTSGPASASTGSSPLNRPWRRRRRLAHLVLIHRSIQDVDIARCLPGQRHPVWVAAVYALSVSRTTRPAPGSPGSSMRRGGPRGCPRAAAGGRIR